MTRRGGPISEMIWDPYSVRGPEVKSITGAFAKVQYNSVVVILFTVIAILGLFCILLLMSNSGWTSADFQLQSSYEQRILKIENLRLSLEASKKKMKKLDGEKKNLRDKLELVSKKFLDMRIEFDKANKNAKRVKTEMDDHLHHALTEGSKALHGVSRSRGSHIEMTQLIVGENNTQYQKHNDVNYHNSKARADELEETLGEVRAERRQIGVENEALAVKLGRAIQKGEAAEDEITKLKTFYRIRSDTPKGMFVPHTAPVQRPKATNLVTRTEINPIRIIPDEELRTAGDEIHLGHSHRKLPSKAISKTNDNVVFETVLVSPPAHDEHVQTMNRDEV